MKLLRENESRLVRSLEDWEYNTGEDQHLGRASKRDWAVFRDVEI